MDKSVKDTPTPGPASETASAPSLPWNRLTGAFLAGIPFFVIALILFFSKKGKIDSAQNGKKSLGFAP